MESTIHYAQNADESADAAFLKNLPLLKLLAKEGVEAADWELLISSAPETEDKVLWCINTAGALCALDADDFDDWVVYCSTVVSSLLDALQVDASDNRSDLLSIGLAARTFNFEAHPIGSGLKCADMLRRAAEYRATEDADIFSMWFLLQVLTAFLRLDFNSNLRQLIDAMKKMNAIRPRYRAIVDRLPKPDKL